MCYVNTFINTLITKVPSEANTFKYLSSNPNLTIRSIRQSAFALAALVSETWSFCFSFFFLVEFDICD